MVKNDIEQLTSLKHHFIEDLNTFLKTLPEHLFWRTSGNDNAPKNAPL